MAEPGRLYRIVLDCGYAGGTLPADTADVIDRMLRADARGLTDLEFVVVPGHHSAVRVTATARAANPVAAVTRVDAAVDDVLASTGLLEEFDITGKVIRVAPLERADQLGRAPDPGWVGAASDGRAT